MTAAEALDLTADPFEAASPFRYVDGHLHADDIPLARIAEAVGTPAYIYSATGMRHNYRALAAALDGLDVTICYAVKANSNLAVIRALATVGAGADVVSGGEIRRVLAAGVPPDRTVFSSVGKTEEELRLAVQSGLCQINVESAAELEMLSAVAVSMGVEARVAIRVNPDVDARTHDKITTGIRGNKFGIEIEAAPEVYRRAASLPGIAPVGVAVHIGSQLMDLLPFRVAYTTVANLVGQLRSEGLPIDRIDLGGGIGIPYHRDESSADLTRYAAIVRETVGGLGCRLFVEPGRLLTGTAGVLLTRVLFIKHGDGRDFVIVDAAMNDLLRPAMYDAWHTILPVTEAPADAALRPFDVVGPVCETADTFAKERLMPAPADGDLLAFANAGAYGAVMSSAYNTRPLVPEVLVDGAQFAVVRKRPTFEEMVSLEAIPDWLAAPTD